MQLRQFGFFAHPGRCWRLVTDPDPRKEGQPLHCSELVAVRGVFVTTEGKRFQVESCEEHTEGLVDRQVSDRTDRKSDPPGR